MFRSSTLEGPPSPGFMRDSIQVSGKQLQQYTQSYDSYTASTKGTRDSLRTSVQAVRAAYQSGDRAQARTRRESVESQWKQLADKDKKFEDGLKNVLTKEQDTRYQQWRQKRKEEAREQWRQRRTEARRNGWTAHHDSSGSRQPSDSGKAPTK
jgi:Spy/CpxP family protein refolding chaperone